MKKYLLLILWICAFITVDAQILVTSTQVNTINATQSAAEGDLYKDTDNNVYYIGLSSGLLKVIGDVAKIDATLTGDGSVANPLGIAQMGASSGQVLSWNGTAWAPVNPPTATTTVSNAIVSGQLTTTVNGVASTPVTLPTSTGSATYMQNGSTTTVSGNGSVWNPYWIETNTATTTERGVLMLTGDFAGNGWWPVIANGAVVNSRLGANAVTTDKIQNGTIKTEDLEWGLITNDKLAFQSVSYDRIQQMPAHTLLGNPYTSAASPIQITLGTGLSFSGNVLNATQSQVRAIQVYDNLTTNQTIGNNATTLRLNSVPLNLGSNYSLSNSEITVSLSGVYRISYTAGTTSGSSNGEYNSRYWIEINGVINQASYLFQHTYAGSSFCSSTSIIVQLNANSVVRVRMSRLDNTSLLTVPECSALNIEKID